MSFARSPGSEAVSPRGFGSRSSRRALEIVGVVFLFFYVWPLAAAYLAWKFLGYPVPAELRSWFERGLDNPFRDVRFKASSFGGSGNRAFDDYRRSEIDRLEAERKRLDEEAREFRGFVEDLKRAKDRDEFDAFMAARRRAAGGTASA